MRQLGLNNPNIHLIKKEARVGGKVVPVEEFSKFR